MFRLITLSSLTGLILVATHHAQRQNQPRRVPFQQVFSLRGVELSKEQQAKVEKLREQYVPKLSAVSRKRNEVYTREQRTARREAIEAARKAGKRGQELQKIVADAVKLTDEQKKKLDTIQKEQTELVETIQKELRALLTEEQRRRLQNRNQNPRRPNVRPTHGNIKYATHERNVMDVWLPESDKPTPVLVSIHGGGFRGGNKSVNASLLRGCLDSKIAVVAITYRLSQHAIAPASFHDCARAIQFIRSKAKEWNLDKKRFAATGGSAGAGLSLWLGFHDDFAKPDSKDPILRESTRLSCMVVYNGQTSYDPRFIRKLFPGTDTYQHSALAQLFDVDLKKLDDLPKEKHELFEEVSALPHLTKDDAPALLIYGSKMDAPITSQGVGIHHPRFGKVLKEKMDKLKIECHVVAGSQRNNVAWTEQPLNFIKKHFEQ